jgi:hypothetical protein
MRNDCVDALRISETEQQSILKELDAADSASSAITQRLDKRHTYFVREGLVLEVEGATARFIVRPRDVSASGIGFLHGSFLHPGRACVVALRTIDGEGVLVSGRVVRCRCVRGRIHDVGMHFDKPIDLDNFVGVRERAAASSAPPAANAPPAGAYNAEELLLLIGQFQALVDGAAPRDQLFEKLARMIALLRENAA